MTKKILVIDDSALMRRVLCDIINSDDRFEVVGTAVNGAEGFTKIISIEPDAVVLDVYMPQMTGLQLLEEMQKSSVKANVLMASTKTTDGAQETLRALELGAIDFITKPERAFDIDNEAFKKKFLGLLWIVANANPMLALHKIHNRSDNKTSSLTDAIAKKLPSEHVKAKGKKIVAIASSTGGPRALQEVIPKLPKNLAAPVLLVQHMPDGFTKSLADRLNEDSEIAVEEAKENTRIEKGHVYIARGGKHLKAVKGNMFYHLELTGEPSREGVRPCANYMYESLIGSEFDEVVCVVLTGMGCDGTEGILNLSKSMKVHVIAQDEATSTVYGMPRAIAQAGKVNEIVPLNQIADRITREVGVL